MRPEFWAAPTHNNLTHHLSVRSDVISSRKILSFTTCPQSRRELPFFWVTWHLLGLSRIAFHQGFFLVTGSQFHRLGFVATDIRGLRDQICTRFGPTVIYGAS